MKQEVLAATTAAIFAGVALLPINMPGQARAAESPFSSRMHKMEVGSIHISNRNGDNPENPAVPLLHGFPTSWHMFRNLIPEPAAEYAPDHPGFGVSNRSDAVGYDDGFAKTTNIITRLTDSKLRTPGRIG